MSPDLEVRIRSAALTRQRARAIVAEVNQLARHVQIGTYGIRSPALDVWAHDILSEAADWDAATWEFEPTELDRLEATLRRVSDLVPEEFTLEASWASDRPNREVAVTRDELLALVTSNQIGNRVLYRVLPAAGR